MAAKTRSKSFKPGSFLRVAYSAPPPSENAEAEIRRFTLPATKALPFVRLSPNDQPMLRPESFWHVRPSGKRERDVQTGRQYAQLAIAAMKADHEIDLIALVVQDIIKDSVARSRKNGRGTSSPAALGFLAEISELIATAP